jgi:hypothetical protein
MAARKAKPKAAPRKRRGPPSKVPDVRGKFLDAIRTGNTVTCAAALVGVDRTTIYRWFDMEAALSADDPDPDGLRGFHDDFRRAMAEAEKAVVEPMHSAAKTGDTKAATWWLERRRRATWGPDKEVLRALQQQLAELTARVAALAGAGDGGGETAAGGAGPRPDTGPADHG